MVDGSVVMSSNVRGLVSPVSKFMPGVTANAVAERIIAIVRIIAKREILFMFRHSFPLII